MPLTTVMTALFGAFIAWHVMRWRHQADKLDRQTQILLKMLTDLADLSAKYWLKSASEKGVEAREILLDEALIQGALTRVERQVELITPLMRKIDLLGIDTHWVPFLDALNGGDFSDPDRPTDPERALSVQVYASRLMADYQRGNVSRY